MAEVAGAAAELGRVIAGLTGAVADGSFGADPGPETIEAHRWVHTIARVGLLAQVWADPDRPRFADIVGADLRWGGDNTDAFYQHASVRPGRTYRVTGRPGDAVYWSLTVYGGPDDGRYSTHIVGSVNDREVSVGADGAVEIIVGPDEGADIVVAPDSEAVAAITRDYLVDLERDRRMEWSIERIDGPPLTSVSPAEEAARWRAAANWVREQAQIVPVRLEEPNVVQDPYPVPTTTFGWAAGDAAYAMGAFDLAPDEALVIEGRSPDCAFWNVVLWNHLLHTLSGDEGRVGINGHTISLEADGSWRVVIAARDPGHPNWLCTRDHPRGLVWFRWFLPESTPDRPETRVVSLSSI